MSTHPFAVAAREAVAAATGVAADLFKVDVPPPPKKPGQPALGDLAINVIPAARAIGEPPPAVAARVVASFAPRGGLASATATGPFVNFKIDRAAGFRWVIDRAIAGTLVPKIGDGQTICIDYSSPNISKELAYHHVRSTSIGHALAQIFRGLGYRVVGINHLGDWGTTHGNLIAACQRWGVPEPLTVESLNQLYVRFGKEKEDDPTLADEGRAWFKRLEQGDPDARALWQRFRDVSWAVLENVYDLLGITFDEVRGESAYEPDLPRVIDEYRAKGLAVDSEGALVVFLPDEKNPLLLLKADGATTYGTRDIAAAQYRWNTYHFARSLYVVAREQSYHFRQVFKALALGGHEWASRCEHVPFGLVLLDGTKSSTRKGGSNLLMEVFREAIDAVRPRVAEAHADLPAEKIEHTARLIGTAGVLFANLVTQRDKDIDFELEKALALTGDSGPYVQNSHVRCMSIQRKAGVSITAADAAAADVARLVHDSEWAIAKRLLDFGDHVVRAGAAYEPHLIAHYLLDLSSDFARWFTAGMGEPSLRALTDDPGDRAARLALVAAVQATLREGLALLGIGAPDVM